MRQTWARTSCFRLVLTILLMPGLTLAGSPLAIPAAGQGGATPKPLATPQDGGPIVGPTAEDVDSLVKRFPQIDFDPAMKADELAAKSAGPAPALEFVRDTIR
ncbi:MAG: hypothetical protein JWM57_3566, partial [Phycisphaerales bacterium]|nr:hypothetical protein [Phycisphaerales bacterium]